MAKCDNEKAAMLAAKQNLEDKNKEWWSSAINHGAAAITLASAASLVTISSLGVAVVVFIPLGAAYWTSAQDLDSKYESSEEAENSYHNALKKYCDCIG